MPRAPSLRTAFAAAALVLLVAGLLPVVGAVADGEHRSGDATITRESKGGEPPRNLTLAVTFTSNATGEPAAAVPVDVVNRWHGSDDAGGVDRRSAATDGNGTLALQVSRGTVSLTVDDPAWQETHVRFPMEGNMSFEVPLRPSSEDLARIEGVVASENGTPLPEASVEVDPVRDCDEDRCKVRHAERGTRRTLDVDGTEVDLTWEPHDRNARVQVGDGGRYAVAVPAGNYSLTARAPDHVEGREEVQAGAGRTTQRNLTLTPIPPDSVTIRGTVVDAETGDPITGAVVTVENPRWGSHDRVETGEDGTYEVETKPGHLVVEVRAEPGAGHACVRTTEAVSGHGSGEASPSAARPEPRECEDGQGPEQAYYPRSQGLSAEAGSTRELTLELRPEPEPTARIEGWVLEDGTGEPLPNASVVLENERTDDWGHARPDANGSFAADVPAGYYTVRVRADGHLRNATNVLVEDGETVQVVLRAPAGEPADRGCCFAGGPGIVYEDRSASGHGGDAEGADGAAGGVPAGPGGPTIDGGPGHLGPYQASSSTGPQEADRSKTPAAGAAFAAAALAVAAAAAVRVRRD